jgi:hypothetical protein
MSAQMQAQYATQYEAMLRHADERAQAQFQRQLAEMQAQQTVRTWAQNATTPTINRQHAVPGTTDELYALAMDMPSAVRSKFMAYVDRVNATGLISFEEIGAAGEGAAEASAKERFDGAVSAKVAGGMSRYAAMQAVQKEQPALYAAYQSESRPARQAAPTKGGR